MSRPGWNLEFRCDSEHYICYRPDRGREPRGYLMRDAIAMTMIGRCILAATTGTSAAFDERCPKVRNGRQAGPVDDRSELGGIRPK